MSFMIKMYTTRMIKWIDLILPENEQQWLTIIKGYNGYNIFLIKNVS